MNCAVHQTMTSIQAHPPLKSNQTSNQDSPPLLSHIESPFKKTFSQSGGRGGNA